jgi:hypothetical protein
LMAKLAGSSSRKHGTPPSAPAVDVAPVAPSPIPEPPTEA